MTTMPIRYDRLEAGLVAWVRAELPDATVVFAPSEYPRPAGRQHFAALRMLAGASDKPIGGAGTQLATLPIEATLTIDPDVAPGDVVGVNASGRAIEYVVGTGEDFTAARDGLFALLVAEDPGPMVSARFEASGDDAITIEALEAGDLYKLGARGSAVVSVEATQLCEVASSSALSLVELATFATRLRYPSDGASSTMARLTSSLAHSAVGELLDGYGLAVDTAGAPANLDQLAGPEWESRAAVTLRVTQLSFRARPIATILRVRGTVQVRSGSTLTFDVDTDLSA